MHSVNRLAWNEDGSMLASCSDDLQVVLWRLERGGPVATFSTSHKNNILGIKFIPQCGSQAVVTGAMDGMVEVHNLSDRFQSRINSEQFHCHLHRVKYVEVEPMNPNLFFSAGEDGCTRQYDLRLPLAGCIQNDGETGLASMYDSKNCIISQNMHTLSVRVNPVDTNLLVTASGDSKIRVYDRRMLGLCTAKKAREFQPCKVYCPAHLTHARRTHSTYAEFSPCGRSIIANYHSEHTYLFDVNGSNSSNDSQVWTFTHPS